MMHSLLLVSLLQISAAQSAVVASDGRIAYESGGSIYLMRTGEPAARITSGAFIDRQPAWSPDGKTIVFVSDRAGGTHLYRIAVDGLRATGAPERLTSTADADTEPSVAPDGRIVFVRGTGAAADLWIREANGAEKKLVSAAGNDRSPSVSRDGVVVFSATREGRRQLRSIRLDGTQDRVVLSEPVGEFPAWSPDGKRIAFVSTVGRRPVMVTPADGSYANTVGLRRGKPVWIDDQTLLLSEIANDGPGYNGDPDRLNDREAERDAGFDGTLWRVSVPALADAGLTNVEVARPTMTEADRTDYFDRAIQRVTDLYFSKPDQSAARATWERVGRELRTRAAQTRTQAELDELVHDALRRRPPLRTEATGRAGVSSAHPLATEAGLEILRKGGNVVDAAVAVSFALSVVEPDASGIGGYGQMLIQVKGMDKPALIEFMARAPEAATATNPAMSDPNLSRPARAIVPGTVDGMHRAWQRYGSKQVKWADLIEPAIRLAENGYVLDESFTTTLRREQEEFLRYDGARALFFRDGKPLASGDTLRNKDLAWTLRQIATGGADAFYRGEIARRLVNDLRARGSVITLNDMARYYAEWREPVTTTYRNHTIWSSAPPVSGGATLAAQLNTLENFKALKPATEDAASAHAMIEAWRIAPARNRIADPSLWPVDITAAVSKDSARARWNCFFNPNKAVSQADLNARRCANAVADTVAGAREEAESLLEGCDVSDPAHVCRATGTTSFAVGDGDGNLVAVTQTLGTWGGTFYVTPGLGFLYNDKLGSYGGPEAFGARLPYARHTSNIAPTLVFKGVGREARPWLAVGAAGNAWITAAVYQMVTGAVDHGMSPQQLVELPRFLPGGGGGGGPAGPGGGGPATGEQQAGVSNLQIEAGFSPAVLARLEQLGHRFTTISLPGELRMGYAAAVMSDKGSVKAGADPRRSGGAGAVR
jgi:gamma-glutamyltranspeptidase